MGSSSSSRVESTKHSTFQLHEGREEKRRKKEGAALLSARIYPITRTPDTGYFVTRSPLTAAPHPIGPSHHPSFEFQIKSRLNTEHYYLIDSVEHRTLSGCFFLLKGIVIAHDASCNLIKSWLQWRRLSASGTKNLTLSRMS